MVKLLETNEDVLSRIEKRYYFDPIRRIMTEKIAEVGEVEALNYLTEVMQRAKAEVDVIIEKRKEAGLLRDPDQTRKSVAGNAFQALVAYNLIKLQQHNKLDPHLIITLKPKSHALVESYGTIQVGAETQRPDIDLLIYQNVAPEQHPVMIYSIKTSLRERAGQTCRWKLLMDVTTAPDCESIRKKYGLQCDVIGNFKTGFITTNFYSEIMQPQQQGLLRFFDYVYITKKGSWEPPVCEFSTIIKDLNQIYS